MKYLSIIGLTFLILACEDKTIDPKEVEPDLVVELHTENITLEAGGGVKLSATVSNEGGAESEPTTLRYYQSSDDSLSNDDTQIGTDDIDSLQPRDSKKFAFSATVGNQDIVLSKPTIPHRSQTAPILTNLAVFYFASVDSVSGESKTDNNHSSAVPSVEAVDIRSVEDASGTEGGTLNFTVNLTSELLQPATFYFTTYYGCGTAEQGDYDGHVQKSVTVSSGSSFTIDINTIQDDDYFDETFYLYVSVTDEALENTPPPSKNRGTGTIYDNTFSIGEDWCKLTDEQRNEKILNKARKWVSEYPDSSGGQCKAWIQTKIVNSVTSYSGKGNYLPYTFIIKSGCTYTWTDSAYNKAKWYDSPNVKVVSQSAYQTPANFPDTKNIKPGNIIQLRFQGENYNNSNPGTGLHTALIESVNGLSMTWIDSNWDSKNNPEKVLRHDISFDDFLQNFEAWTIYQVK